MKKDAFDDLSGPFNYNVELMIARETLHAKIGTYISENGGKSYRQLAEEFGISPAALCAIAKTYSRKRKRGRLPGRKRPTSPRSLVAAAENVTFNVRHKIGEQELQTTVIVRPSRLLLRRMASSNRKVDSVELMRDAVARYFKTENVSVALAGDIKNERRAEYTYDELWNLSGSLLLGSKPQSEIEVDLATLKKCVEKGTTSDAGGIASQGVMRWLSERRRNKAERLRAKGLVEKYKKLGTAKAD